MRFSAIVFASLLTPVFATNLPAPLSDESYHPVDIEQAKLGQLLFFDKLLSGNQNISCATCHHPSFGSGDGLSLGIGEGGMGVGTERDFGEGELKAERRVPRNAPALWNIGATEFSVLFHDGRLSHSDMFDSGFDSPAEEFLPDGLSDIVAAQALFPLTAEVEMAGDKNENEVPGAATRRADYAWRIIADRIRNTPGYPELFADVYDDVNAAPDITIVHVANALSAFERFEFRADNSLFDQYLRGNERAMSDQQKAGMALFYGKANCSICHAGPLQTDHDFHNIAMPFLGPGRTRRFDFKARDMGRINESDYASDAYKFRTPSLRNVTETAPYGHNGAYSELADVIRHHTDPLFYFENYSLEKATLPSSAHIRPDNLLWADRQEQMRMKSTLTDVDVQLSEEELQAVLAFMTALTDEESLEGRLGVPESVPSNLQVDK